MEFNEEKAQEIISKYGLSDKTLRVWKTRRSIPDKYANEEYKKKITITENGDKLMQDRIISILKMNELNRKTIVQLAGCDMTRVNGVCVHKSTLTKEEMFVLQKEIKRLRIDIMKYTQKFSDSFLKLIQDKRLKLHVIIKDKSAACKLKYICEHPELLTEYDYKQVVDNYIRVAIQLNIN